MHGLNNQRSNLQTSNPPLRTSTMSGRTGARSSRYKGVTWHRQLGKWQATIKIDGKKSSYSACLPAPEDARSQLRLYPDRAAENAFGKFASPESERVA